MSEPHTVGGGMSPARRNRYALAFLRDVFRNGVRDPELAARRIRTRLGYRADVPIPAIRAWVNENGFHPADVVLAGCMIGYVGWYPTKTAWRQKWERLPLQDKLHVYLYLRDPLDRVGGYVFRL